jgi:hypothetical protein
VNLEDCTGNVKKLAGDIEMLLESLDCASREIDRLNEDLKFIHSVSRDNYLSRDAINKIHDRAAAALKPKNKGC